MVNTQEIIELVAKLNQTRHEYYNNSNSIMSDYEYDELFDKLEQLENESGIIFANSPTQTVGYEVVSELQKTKHSHLMLSLNKTKSLDELSHFLANDKVGILSLKMDGLTCLLTYENGKLVKAETRGNGEIGEDITHNAYVFENIPITIPIKTHFEVEGEAIITYEDFNKINDTLPDDEKYKNPRNLASGSVRQLDSNIAKSRHIRFVAWKIPSGYSNMTGGFEYAKKIGFEVVPFEIIRNSDVDTLAAIVNKLRNIATEKSYPIDGLVLAYNDVEYGYMLGNTGHHPRHSIAYKFYDEEVETQLIDVDWTIGKTGQLTPTAVFEPIEIDGTTVARASLHNISIMKGLELGYDDTITVYKANAIIPQIRDNLTRKGNYIRIPKTCPYCNGDTCIEQDNETQVLYCRNLDCNGTLAYRLAHFCSRDAMNINGLSIQTILQLMDLGVITKYEAIYNLQPYVTKLKSLEGFGDKSVNKLIESIEASKTTTLERFLYALSIPLIGKTASKQIASFIINDALSKDYGGHTNGDIWGYFFEVVTFESANFWQQIPDFGCKMAESLVTYFSQNGATIDQVASYLNFEVPVIANSSNNNINGKSFVVTGSVAHFKNRDELSQYITDRGGKVVGSVSKNTDYLINNDVESNSSKNKKAKELNIPIISENQFLELFGDN